MRSKKKKKRRARKTKPGIDKNGLKQKSKMAEGGREGGGGGGRGDVLPGLVQ